ncbi:MAG: phosphoenolpyruvate--protein phosphotransferase, partial [Rhodospirillales bacterium]|nr:phosphoenolpyruvate--protein phosphotransferase [Rhodospirillales bacterium]
AAAGRPLSVMFPMVATVAEFRAARGLLLAEAKRVRPAPARLQIGTMLEGVVQAAGQARVPVSLCGEAASRPLEAMVLAAIGLTTLSMPAGGILPVKALLARVDMGAFRPVLSAIRRGSTGTASLRDPITTWAREHGLAV